MAKKKKRNIQDLTLINLRATKKIIVNLRRRVLNLENKVRIVK